LFSAYLALSVIALAGIPVAAFGLRDTDLGRDFGRNSAQELHGVSLREAMVQPVFWLLSVSFFLFCLASTGVVIHLVPAMGERGIAPTETSILFVALSLGSLVGRLAIGFTVDRVFAPRILFAVFSLAAISCLALVEAPFGWVLLSVALLGFAIGAEVDLIAFLAAGYFGLRHYGKVYGVLYTMFALGSAVGPPLVGWVRDETGDYVVPFVGCTASMAAAASLFILIGRHRFPSYDRPPVGETAAGTGTSHKG
jgi:MFS family permease